MIWDLGSGWDGAWCGCLNTSHTLPVSSVSHLSSPSVSAALAHTRTDRPAASIQRAKSPDVFASALLLAGVQGGVLQDHLRLQADAGLLQRDLQVSLLIPCARSSARRLLQLPRGVVGAGRRWLFAHATEDSGGGWGEAGRREGWGILAGQAMLGCAAGSLLSFSSFPAESSLSESKSQARLT